MFSFLPLSLLLLHNFVAGHSEPKTPEQIEVQRSLQAAAYHCAPAIGEFTAARKRAWAQKVLAGRPQLPGYQDLFADDKYADLAPSSSGHKLLSCIPEEEVKIQNNSCVLTPVVTEGPYYHTEGHIIRQNMAELQFGLLLLLDIGVIDVNTCEPVPNVLVDIWHANGTGHYAGHPDPFPHLVTEQPQVGGTRSGLLTRFPRTKFEEHWLRAAWPTDENGVSQFTTIFPGYYTGRATHIHTKVFTDWEPMNNGSFKAGRLAHIGQFFFDDEVNMQIDKMWPYNTNPIKEIRGRTRNWRDSLNIFMDSHGPEGKYNPVFDLHLVGSIINQGLIGYITMGVNMSASYENEWKG